MSRISGSSYASKLMGRAGDGSTLTLDFTAMGGTIDPRITFSRADATPLATFINSLGYVETVATAQAPRFDFVGGVAKGLLLEAPATNNCRQSSNPGSWLGATSGTTITTGTGFAPDNITVPKQIAMTASAYHAQQSPPSLAIGTYTFSVWLKASSAQLVGMRINRQLNGANSNMIVASVTTSWQRFSVSLLTTAVDVIEVDFDQRNGGAGSVLQGPAVAATFLMWGAQLEASPVPSSNIETTTLAVTRAADTAIIAAGSNFSSWYTGGTTGTFVSNWYGSASSSTARSVIATNDQTTKHLHMYQTASALTLRLADFNAVATVTTANSLTADALTKGAFSYNGTATSLCLNGGTVATNTLGFSAAPTWLSIGGPSTNGTSITDTTVMLNNSIRTLKYFPARLTDGQIQGLTA